MSDIKEKYVTIEEAAEIANRKSSLIRILCREGRFPGAVKMGNSWIIPREEVEAYKPAKRGPKTQKMKLAAERKAWLGKAKDAEAQLKAWDDLLSDTTRAALKQDVAWAKERAEAVSKEAGGK